MESNPVQKHLRNTPDMEDGYKVKTPEYWIPRQELPFSRDYIGFQVEATQKLADLSGSTLTEMADKYATLFQDYRSNITEQLENIEGKSIEQLTQEISAKEMLHASTQPLTPYHEYGRFGCFSCHVHRQGEFAGRIDIHFSNAEFDPVSGPLSQNKIGFRQHELRDMFQFIQSEYPEADRVHGNSWLYNIEAYQRLFPNEYLEHAQIDETSDSLSTGRFWGQFADNRLV